MLEFFAKLVYRAALIATRVFYRLSRQGEELPAGPLVVVANHPNSVMDALVVLAACGRRVHPLARAPLFERPVIGQVLRSLGGLPVYRPQDDPARVGRNETSFHAAVAALAGGEAVLIFPEGMSHSDTELAPLRTGAARIALRAEAESRWELGLRIVPVGLTYSRKAKFRGEAVACVGAPMAVALWRAPYGRDPAQAVRDLTDAIASALERVMVHFAGPENEPLLHAAEALYAAEHGLASPATTPNLAERWPRLKLLAEGMIWLRAHEPERFASLARAVQQHRSRLERVGLRGGELPAKRSALETLRVIGADGAVALLGLPLAILGVGAWYVPYVTPRAVLLVHRPAHEAVATVKLVTSLAAFPAAYAVWLYLAWRGGHLTMLILMAVLLPLAGLVSLYWRDHWRELLPEARFRLLVLRRHGLDAELRARRTRIAAEIDRVADDWEAETQRRVRPR